jgi:hypothetical protein
MRDSVKPRGPSLLRASTRAGINRASIRPSRAGQIEACAELDDALKAVAGRPLALDLEGCTFIDTMGLGVIVRAGTRSDTAGHKLVLHLEALD